MIEPYLSHVQRALGALPGPPFAISRNDTYVIEASNNVMTVRFLIESSIEPIISVAVLDNSGKVFDVSLLEELIDPERLDRKRRLLRELTDTDDEKRRSFEITDEYARICTEDLVDFLKDNQEEFVEFPKQIEARYANIEKSFLKRFGVDQ
ncbi:hypothetical protein KZJ38_23535 [Paraburkholderia edwinii]|jgi:hypothetical protein|uniref:Uncharacterized protein n=1 Tax=Paraburkholderia edwinii TaxID=2861782 RepID=A0ABX8UVJ8_9BURK|nr:hypothetical protein [Paraburkholderia edwinii]QYD72676.1 hypothetical protein KZJ38_23535 [Paraburkholderia edwinii]